MRPVVQHAFFDKATPPPPNLERLAAFYEGSDGVGAMDQNFARSLSPGIYFARSRDASRQVDLNEQKQQFSLAYVRAVAATAGFAVARPETDDDSVDLTILAKLPKRPRIDLQVKCTAARGWLERDHIPFDLDPKNYGELREEDVAAPRVLVVVTVPSDCGSWLAPAEEETLLRYCGYWVSLRGLEERGNVSSVRVRVPRANILSPGALSDMMARISAGGLP